MITLWPMRKRDSGRAAGGPLDGVGRPAAFVFQPLGVLPLPIAAVLFSFLNLALWVVAIVLTRDIVAHTSKRRDSIWLPVALAGVLTVQFFLDNFHHVQMNEVICVLILLGIRAYLRERDLAAAACIVTATSIEVSPVFFASWRVCCSSRWG